MTRDPFSGTHRQGEAGGRSPATLPASAGVTLIELIGLIVLLSVLSILAAEQYRYLRARAQESALRGDLGAVRGALLIYYGDTGGTYPAHLATLAVNKKYIEEIPREDIPPVKAANNPGHKGVSAAEQIYSVMPSSSDFKGEGSALWGYMNEPRRSGYGHLFVNCHHSDSKSTPWIHW